jgi:hypothetical protein
MPQESPVRSVLAVLLLSACAAGCGSTTGTTPSPTTPTATTPAPAPAAAYKVTGTVTDQQTGRGIASAVVQVMDGVDANKAAVTAADGTFSLTGLAPQDITLKVSATGYVALTRAMTLKGDARLDAVLQSAARVISGHVTDGTSGGVLPNILITVVAGVNAGTSTRTDANGNYLLPGVTSDPVGLTASATSYVSSNSIVAAGGDTVQNFVLARVAAPTPTPIPTPAPAPVPPAGGVVIGFSQLGGLPYTESGYTIVSTQASWGPSGYGNPGPSLQFVTPLGTTTEGEVRITAAGAGFRFSSIDLYSSVTPIPYVFTGIAGSSTVFAVTGRQGNTFGNFVRVANPQSSAPIDTLLIHLTNTLPNTCCGSNPMGIDNVVILR